MIKDVKNADRSGEVYENKGQLDRMPDKKSDFVSDSAEISRNLASFSRNAAEFVSDQGLLWTKQRCLNRKAAEEAERRDTSAPPMAKPDPAHADRRFCHYVDEKKCG